MKKIVFITCTLLNLSGILYSQDFGANHPGINWQQINTDTARIIFSKGFEKQAQRIANTIHYVAKNNTGSVGSKLGKIDIVLQPFTTIPNGYVGLAPLRSEFYIAPPQDPYTIGSIDWMDALAIHEYRHVLQNYNARVGLTRLAYILQGEVGWAVLAGLSIPNWYFEGDAVVTETALSNSGRGRLPYFTLEQRALFLNKKNYRYIKARNGSYKSLLPNHYPLGYTINSYARRHFGNDIWKTVLNDAARYKGVFFPFTRNLKKHTGLNVKTMYTAAYEEAAMHYNQELEKLQFSETKQVNVLTKGKTVTNYEYPYFINDSTIICVKNSYKKTSSFTVITNEGVEKKLFSKGSTIDHYFTCKNGKLAWTELTYDARWTNRNYSEVITYDMATGKRRRLGRCTNFFSPEFSNKGDKLVVVHITDKKEYTLEVIDAASGKTLKTLSNPDNLFLFHPKWTSDDKEIVVVSKKDSKLSLIKYNIDKDNQEQLTPYTSQIISQPFLKDDTVYFSSSLSGIDNIYALHITDKTIYQVSSVKLGAYQPVISNNGKYIAFSEFSLMGYNISKMLLQPDLFKAVNLTEPSTQITADSLIINNEGGSIANKIPGINYPVKKYNQLSHAVNIHSWQLIFAEGEYGLMLQSQNILNNLAGNISSYYNTNDNRLNSSIGATYAGLYPYINAGTGYIHDFSGNPVKINEHYFYAGLSIPLTFSRGLYQRQLNAGITFFNRNIFASSNNQHETISRRTTESKLAFSNLRIKAYQNIYSRFGQAFAATYNSTLDRQVRQLLITGNFFFPGIAANHSLILESAYQQKTAANNNFLFTDNFIYPRGYSKPVYMDIFKLGLNYHLPLFYPDWGINGIIYFKRIRANLFYDCGITNNLKTSYIKQSVLSSCGAEFTFDINIANTLPLSLGFREVKLLKTKYTNIRQNKQPAIELFLSTKL